MSYETELTFGSENSFITAHLKFSTPIDFQKIVQVRVCIMKIDWFRDKEFSSGRITFNKTDDPNILECIWGYQEENIPPGIYYCSTLEIQTDAQQNKSLMFNKDFPWTGFEIGKHDGDMPFSLTHIQDIPSRVNAVIQFRTSHMGDWSFLRDDSGVTSKHYKVIALVENAKLPDELFRGELQVIPVEIDDHNTTTSSLKDLINEYLIESAALTAPNISEDIPLSKDGFLIRHSVFSNYEPKKIAEVLEEKIYMDLVADYGFLSNQTPRVFCVVLYEKSEGKLYSKFNKLQPQVREFENIDTIADQIDQMGILREQQPWQKLIVKLYQDAQIQDDTEIKFLKLWNILEIISKKQIADGDLLYDVDEITQLFHVDGTSPIISGKSWTKVYELVRREIDENYPFKLCMYKTELNVEFVAAKEEVAPKIKLAQFIQQSYGIRCLIAHRGSIKNLPPIEELEKYEQMAAVICGGKMYGQYYSAVNAIVRKIILKLVRSGASRPNYKILYDDIDSNMARILYDVHPNDYNKMTREKKRAVFLDNEYLMDLPFDIESIE